MMIKDIQGTLGNCSPDNDPTCNYKSVVECGECNKEFNTSKELDEHDKAEHPPKPEYTLPEETQTVSKCDHLHTFVKFTGVNHMDIETASGYFKEVCKECKQTVGKEFLVEFVRDQTISIDQASCQPQSDKYL